MAAVVSLLIERVDQPNHLLMGIRDPVANERHPGVLSTITQRIPETLSGSLPGDSPRQQGVGATALRKGLLSYVAESVLCRKLELSGALETAQFSGSVVFARQMTELVDDPLGSQAKELTCMMTLRLLIARGFELIPATSTSYLKLNWVEKENLSIAYHARDALILVPDADPFMVCIHGLCVKSAIATLDEAMSSAS
jgi:hypothetical protein